MEKKKTKKRATKKKASKGQKKVQKPRIVKSKKVIKKKEKLEKKFSLNYIFFLLTFFILCISFLSFLTFLFVKNYQNWEVDFLESDVMFLDFQNEVVDLNEKILKYNESRGEYIFIEFTKEESLFLISQALDESLPDWVELQKTGLFTSSGMWSFYVKTKIWSFDLPWFEILLFKDSMQSVEIYVADVFLGNLSFKNLKLNSIVEKINDGFGRAIRLVNDGNFAGRVFENIELGQESLVIKSRKISP